MTKQQAEWDPGLEYLDPTPVGIPVGAQRPESLADTMRRLIRNELSQAAASAGLETFEESIDFDVDSEDEVEHQTAYEQAADMQEELLEGQQYERDTIAEQRAMQRLRRGRSVPSDDARDGTGSGSPRGGDRRMAVPVDRRTGTRQGDVRREGGRGEGVTGKDSARQRHDEETEGD